MTLWIGIDVGASTVKVAVVRSTYRRLAWVGAGRAEIDRTTTASADAPNDSAEERALRAAYAMATEGIKVSSGDSIAAAVDGAKGSVHFLRFPVSVERQLAEVLPFELEAALPYDLEDAVFDHRVLSRRPDDGVCVLAGVARVPDVQERIDLIKRVVGMEPERVCMGGTALAGLLPYLQQSFVAAGLGGVAGSGFAGKAALSDVGGSSGGAFGEGLAGGEGAPAGGGGAVDIGAPATGDIIALVDLGARRSEVLLVRGMEPVYARTLGTGTEGLPQSAARLGRELRMSFAAHRAAGGAPPVRVYLCGGGSFVSGAEGFLGRELGTPVERLPLPTIELALADNVGLGEWHTHATALGLALSLSGRGPALDLRRGPLAYERGFGWLKEKAPLLAGLSAVLLVSFVFSACARLYSANKDLDVSQKALAVVSKEVVGEETTSAAQARELLGQQNNMADEDPMPHADAYDVLVRLSEAVPASMTHDVEELDVNKGHVTIHGIVGSIPDAQSIAESLKAEPCFAEPKISRTNQMVGTERQKYVLEFDLKCPADQKGKSKGKKDGASSTAAAEAPSAGGKP
jgi:general secretion pathway protein L